MNKNNPLGLPIEYQQLPQFFDAHNINEETESNNALIETLLKKQGVKTVLDITCGTGSQVLYLAQHGYKITGNDLCSGLLDIAREKAKIKDIEASFIEGDMREIQVGQFDAVISIFSAIGHVSKADFEKTLQNIRRNLTPGGIYIFDIFNLQALTKDVVKNFKMDIETEVDGIQFHNQQYSELDREKGMLVSHDTYTFFRNDSEPEHKTNTFMLQLYTAEELKVTLEKNGFELLNQYDMQGEKLNPEKSLNILSVARARFD